MNVRCTSLIVAGAVALTVVACSGGTKRSGFETEADPTESSSVDGGGVPKSGFQGVEAGPSSICGINNENKDPNADSDGDGYPLKHDCNECDPNINEGAYDFPGNGIDEDCNGTPDDEEEDCDTGLSMNASNAFDGAKALGLCKKATNDQMWGVIEAKWVKPDGSPQTVAVGQGILPKFGTNAPQTGQSVLAISSGTARAPGDSGYQDVSGYSKNYTSGTPAGYPKESPACADSGGIGFGFGDESHDGAALQLKIRVPSNAKSFSYQQNFFTYEFPTYICDIFNDFFVTIMEPKPKTLPDGNISFDQDGNPISVNNSLLQVCEPQSAGGKDFTCPLGDSSLSGTGFEGHAATGWLTTTAPTDDVRGKVITLTWTIWDQGDGILDSTALVDDFKWSVEAAEGTQTLPSVPK